MTIDQLTHATEIKGEMRIPVSLYGQTMRISLSQIQTGGSGTSAEPEVMTPQEVSAMCKEIFNTQNETQK